MSKANEISELKDLTAEPTAKHVTKYRLDEINKIKDYLTSETKERKDIRENSWSIFNFNIYRNDWCG